MQEVAVKLQYITPCLGHIRRSDYDRFEKDATGAVIFMNSWWQRILEYGAQAFGKHQRLVREVRVHPRIEGTVKRFKRYYNPDSYTEHEAFLKGDTVTVRALLPPGLPKDDFVSILNLAGVYRGMSPYGWRDGYGLFEVTGS